MGTAAQYRGVGQELSLLTCYPQPRPQATPQLPLITCGLPKWRLRGTGTVAAWCWSNFKVIPQVPGQRRNPSKKVGGAKSHLESNPIPVRDAQRTQTNLVLTRTQGPHRLQPTRLLHPWDFPGKSTGVGCHCLLWQPLLELTPKKISFLS